MFSPAHEYDLAAGGAWQGSADGGAAAASHGAEASSPKPKYKYVKGPCAVEGCPNRAFRARDGVCVTHGAKRVYAQCSAEGCANRVQNNGVCFRHGAAFTPCRADGCTSRVYARGMCRRHGAAAGIAYPAASPKPRRTCKAKGCTNHSVNGGLCIGHGASRNYCKVEGCTNKRVKGGVCMRHGAKQGLCKHEDCTKYAQIGGVCRSHGAKFKLCEVDGCGNLALRSGVCQRHGAKPKQCRHEGCSNQSHKGGACCTCNKHDGGPELCQRDGCMNRAPRGADVCWTHNEAKKDAVCCAHEGCYARVRRGGFCRKHKDREENAVEAWGGARKSPPEQLVGQQGEADGEEHSLEVEKAPAVHPPQPGEGDAAGSLSVTPPQSTANMTPQIMWQCKRCDNRNALAKRRCAKCNGWRGGKRKAAVPDDGDTVTVLVPSQLQDDSWQCDKCGHQAHKSRCANCRRWKDGKRKEASFSRTIKGKKGYTCLRRGCESLVTVAGGVCTKHKICSLDGCTKPAVFGDVCSDHSESATICRTVGCARVVAKIKGIRTPTGLCHKHLFPKTRNPCAHPGCETMPRKGNERCTKHRAPSNSGVAKKRKRKAEAKGEQEGKVTKRKVRKRAPAAKARGRSRHRSKVKDYLANLVQKNVPEARNAS